MESILEVAAGSVLAYLTIESLRALRRLFRRLIERRRATRPARQMRRVLAAWVRLTDRCNDCGRSGQFDQFANGDWLRPWKGRHYLCRHCSELRDTPSCLAA